MSSDRDDQIELSGLRPGRATGSVHAAFSRLVARRGSGGPRQITEAHGPATSMRRDALFRRMLVVADVAAIVAAFMLTVALSSRSLQLTWAGVAGLAAC